MENHEFTKAGRKRRRKEHGNQKTARKQQDGISKSLLIVITLHVNGLNSPSKKHRADPAIPLLGTYLKEMKAPCQRAICSPMFIVALFTVAKTWKQPKCPSTDEWINKM